MAEEVVYRKILSFLEEDTPFWDTTTDTLIPKSVAVRARVVARVWKRD